MTRELKRIVFVVNKGRLDPASHKRAYDLVEPLASRGCRASVVSIEWELLWRVRSQIEHGNRGLRLVMWLLNATRLMPRLIRARNASSVAHFERVATCGGLVVLNQKVLDSEWIRALRRSGALLVYDVDDAVWVRDEAGFVSMIELADAVVAGNEFLADRIRSYRRPMFVIPTSVRVDRYDTAKSRRSTDSSSFVVGWVGSPSTVRYLDRLVEPLAELGSKRKVAIDIVGAGSTSLPAFRNVMVRSFPKIPYDPVEFVTQFDVGVMPLDDTEFEHGKCGAKALEYMAAGVPTICSPVGENVRIVEDGVSGFLASTSEDWVEALERLAADSVLRHRMGESGRARVMRNYSSELAADKWVEVLSVLAATGNRFGESVSVL